MKAIITVILVILSGALLTAQNYTWEKYHSTATGGLQTAGSYTTFNSSNWYQSGSVTVDDHAGYTGFLTPRLDTRLPVITSIKDVPNDQGKFVEIIWNRSGYDDNYNQVNFYSIWRQDEGPTAKYQESKSTLDIYEALEQAEKYPDKNWFWLADGEVWTYVDDIPALAYDQYSFDAPTLFDFFPPDIFNLSTFKVVFHAVDDYYESESYTGYSIDNLAPAVPVLNGAFMVNHTQLLWDESDAEDFQYFAVYRSTDPEILPEVPYGTTIIPEFTDYEMGEDQLYYAVSAFDFNGNESELSNLLSLDTRIELNLTVFLEGPFFGTEMNTSLNSQDLIPQDQPYNVPPWNYTGDESVLTLPNNDIVDWVLLDLRDAQDAPSATSASTIWRQAAFLLKDGSIVDQDGFSFPQFSGEVDQNLYVAIWHRNHLAVLSSSYLTVTDGEANYDFSNEESKVYGGITGNKALGQGVWGMVAGDANADGFINSGDKISSWTIEVGSPGYLSGDLNMDGQVNNPDKNDRWIVNIGKESQVPE